MTYISDYGLRKGIVISIIQSSFLALVLIFLPGCKMQERELTAASTVNAEGRIKGRVISSDSVLQPQVITAGEPELTRVFPKIPKQVSSNLGFYKNPVPLLMKAPLIMKPGEGGLDTPDTIKAQFRSLVCKAPEIKLVKDPSVGNITTGSFAIYNKLQGLRHDQVRGMVQDSTGNIWLATDDGLIMYDGRYFSRYSTDQGFNNNLFLSVCIDSKSNVWAGTYGGGVVKYDGKYIHFLTEEEGLSGNNVNCLYEDSRGNIWAGTATGLSKYDGENIISFTVRHGLGNDDVRTISEDRQGNIWIGTYGGGLSVFDGFVFRQYTEKQGLVYDFISSLLPDPEGNMWIGSAGRGLLRFDGSVFFYYGPENGLTAEMFYSITRDKSGNIWLGTNGEGLIMFDGRYFTHYSEDEGLSSNIIRCGLSDRDGNLWFGTRGGGFVKFNGNVFTHLNEKDGLSHNRVMSVLETDDGDIWFATFGGYLTRYSFIEKGGVVNRYFNYYGEETGLRDSRIYDLEQDSLGTIWIATEGGGISAFDGKVMRTYTTDDGLCSNYFRDIFIDREGNLWFASYGGGVSKFDGKTFTNFREEQGLSSNLVMSVFQDSKGTMWFGTATRGLTRFDGVSFTHYTADEGFYSNTVYSIMEDGSGNIWFGTGGAGAVLYDGNRFIRCPGTRGPDESHVLALLESKDKTIWIGTRFGLVALHEGCTGEENMFSLKRQVIYDYNDGFTGIGCNLGAMIETSDGKIWIGTTDRLTVYNPRVRNIQNVSPVIQLNEIRLYGEKIPWTSIQGNKDTSVVLSNGVIVRSLEFSGLNKWFAQPEGLNLRHDNNYLTFSYIAVTPSANQAIRYQYFLEGLEENWNLPTDRTEVVYGNLKHGRYTLRVKAVTRDGIESNELKYNFIIRPPWWKTPWFYSLAILTLVLIIIVYVQLRLRKLSRDNEKLEQMVREQTSEIVAKNTELVRQNDHIKEKSREIETKNVELQKLNAEKDKLFSIIAHDLRGPFGIFLGFTEHIISELPRMTNEELTDLVSRMNISAVNLFRLLENLLQWSLIQRGHIDFNPVELNANQLVNESISVLLSQAHLKNIDIIAGVPENIYVKADASMIQSVIRNLVSNAIKFSHPGGKIIISAVLKKDGKTEFSVIDNGVGMSEDVLKKLFLMNSDIKRKGTSGELSTGLGLILCHEFIEIHGGTIRAESTEGKGSGFYFTI